MRARTRAAPKVASHKVSGVDMPERHQGTGKALLERLLMLAPAAAGLAVGVLIVEALRFERLAWRFWLGARPDPESVSYGKVVVTIILSVLAAHVVWVAVARIFDGRRGWLESLRRHAVSFVPFASILVLFVIDAHGIIPDAMLFSVHALVISAGAFVGITSGLAAARPQYEDHPWAPWLERRALVVVCAAAVVYWITFSAMGTLQYLSLRISYTDTASWEQMLWNTMRGRFLVTSAFDHMFFGEHVQFVHLLLLPFYALLPSLVTLMILKSAVLASGAFPVYLLARRRLQSKAAAALLACAYLLYPAMQYVDLELVNNTFRPVAFAIPALLWAVYFLDRRRMWAFSLAAFVALASKEEMALPVMMMGVLLLLDRKYTWGAVVTVFTAVWFVVSVVWVIPGVRGAPTHMYLYYLDFGDDLTFTRLLWRVVSNPLHTLSVALQPVKIDYLLLLFVPLGLRPLFSWRMLLVMLPSLGTTLLASRDPSFTIYYHYQAALVPLLVAGAVYGVENCRSILPRILCRLVEADKSTLERGAAAGLVVLVFASSFFGNILFAQSPLSLLFHNPNMDTHWRRRYVPDERARLFFREVRPLVPPDAGVSATEFLATYFAARRDIHVFPIGLGDVEYLVIDSRDRWMLETLSKVGTTLEAILADVPYRKIYDRDGFLVYRMDGSGGDT